MAFYDPEQNAFVPYQKKGAKIQQINETTGKVTEIDNPEYVPFKEVTQDEIDGYFKLIAKGYKMSAGADGMPILTAPSPLTEAELREQYESRVNALIREKYTLSQELAILRQKDEKPEEYTDYFAYCEECKTQAKIKTYSEQQ